MALPPRRWHGGSLILLFLGGGQLGIHLGEFVLVVLHPEASALDTQFLWVEDRDLNSGLTLALVIPVDLDDDRGHDEQDNAVYPNHQAAGEVAHAPHITGAGNGKPEVAEHHQAAEHPDSDFTHRGGGVLGQIAQGNLALVVVVHIGGN